MYSNRPDFHIGANFESSIRRAKKSLATSFNQLLKREGRESESAEREGSPAEVLNDLFEGTHL